MQQFHMLFQGSQGDSKNAKKKNNKKTNKNKSSISRANKKKPSMPNVSNDLSQKLYATMEKHKEVETRGGRGLAGSRDCGPGPFLVCGIKEKRLPGPRVGEGASGTPSRAHGPHGEDWPLHGRAAAAPWELTPSSPAGLLCDPPARWACHQHTAPHR